jgi:DNA-binding transcriptional LysR family regulator
MRSVAGTLRPGGRLLLIDPHPIACMVATTDPLLLDFPYAYDGPHTFSSDGSYATSAETTTHVQFAHSLGEIVTAAVAAGLCIVRLEEHLAARYRSRTPAPLPTRTAVTACTSPASRCPSSTR